jgi:hypothetical protein
MMKRIKLRILNNKIFRTLMAHWKYRNIDPELCCCGDQMGEGGFMCHYGGCRSAKEYAITCYVSQT